MNINNILTQGIATIFALGGEIIKTAVYVRPAGLSSYSGNTAANELRASCNLLVASYQLQRPRTGDPQEVFERVFIRASELVSIPEPSPLDYIDESNSNIRREVLSSIQDATGLLWIFETKRIYGNQDYGDLTVWTSQEDWGDLTLVSEQDENGVLTYA